MSNRGTTKQTPTKLEIRTPIKIVNYRTTLASYLTDTFCLFSDVAKKDCRQIGK